MSFTPGPAPEHRNNPKTAQPMLNTPQMPVQCPESTAQRGTVELLPGGAFFWNPHTINVLGEFSDSFAYEIAGGDGITRKVSVRILTQDVGRVSAACNQNGRAGELLLANR